MLQRKNRALGFDFREKTSSRIIHILVARIKPNPNGAHLFRTAFNRQSLGDFTKMEGTQMEMFNFLWLILDHYQPLTPTKND